MEEYITIEQLSHMLGITKSTAYKLSSKNIIAKYKPGGKVLLFKRSDVKTYIESKRIASQAELKDSIIKKLFQA